MPRASVENDGARRRRRAQPSTHRRARPSSRITGLLAVGVAATLGACGASATADDTVDAHFPDEGPAFVVDATPPEFSEARIGQVPPGWVPLLAHSGGCVLSGRGALVGESDQDERVASIDYLTGLLDAEGLHERSDARDVDLAVDAERAADEDDDYDADTADAADDTADAGAGETGAAHVLRFVTADGQNAEGSVRIAARLSDAAEGGQSEALALRFACPGLMQETVWAELEEPLRASFHAVPEPGSGWRQEAAD